MSLFSVTCEELCEELLSSISHLHPNFSFTKENVVHQPFPRLISSPLPLREEKCTSLLYIVGYIHRILWKRSFLYRLLPLLYSTWFPFLWFSDLWEEHSPLSIEHPPILCDMLSVMKIKWWISFSTQNARIRKPDLFLSHHAASTYVAIDINILLYECWQTHVMQTTAFFRYRIRVEFFGVSSFDFTFVSSLANPCTSVRPSDACFHSIWPYNLIVGTLLEFNALFNKIISIFCAKRAVSFSSAHYSSIIFMAVCPAVSIRIRLSPKTITRRLSAYAIVHTPFRLRVRNIRENRRILYFKNLSQVWISADNLHGALRKNSVLANKAHRSFLVHCNQKE